MFKIFYPDEYYDSTYSIDFEKLYREGYRGVIFDIDNTLVPHGAPADERSIAFFNQLKEIGFEATITRVEDGIAYATVTEQDAGFLSKKLPESIMFETADLDEELKAGDKISACYMSGTIDGQTVRVVSVSVITD